MCHNELWPTSACHPLFSIVLYALLWEKITSKYTIPIFGVVTITGWRDTPVICMFDLDENAPCHLLMLGTIRLVVIFIRNLESEKSILCYACLALELVLPCFPKFPSLCSFGTAGLVSIGVGCGVQMSCLAGLLTRCIVHTIDMLHKSHNAPGPYPTMEHFVTEMCKFLLQNGALWDICLSHCGNCKMGLLSCSWFI